MRSELHIRLRRHANGVVAASGSLAVPPYWCRWDGTTLWLVGSAATPVGDDDSSLHLEVGEGVTATVRSVAATVVYAASGDGTRLHTHLRVGAGADLRWQPDPVIVTARARHRSSTTIEVDPEGSLLADELVVLGRSDEVRTFFADPANARSDAAYALLGMRREERTVLAPALVDGEVRRDMRQTTVGFAHHTLLATADAPVASRRRAIRTA